MNTVKMGQQTRNKSQPRFDTSKLEIGIGRRDQLKVAVEAEQALAFVPNARAVADYFGLDAAPRQSGSEATRAGMLVEMLADSSSVSSEQLMKVIEAHNANSGVSATSLRSLRKKPTTPSN